MAKKKHPFDVVAEQLEALADKPAAAQDASPDFWEFDVALDDQTALCEPKVVRKWVPGDGLGSDGFPKIPIQEMQLKGRGRWTDVLSTGLPDAWSVGHLLNETALAVFKQFELGTFREYPVTVHDRQGGARTLTYLLIRNALPPTSFDFARSEFYLADMVGIPQAPVAVNSFAEWDEKIRLAREGKLNGCERFSRIDFKRLVLDRDHLPTVDLFTLGRLGITVYISARLKDAIVSSGITGLEIQPNKRLFAGR